MTKQDELIPSFKVVGILLLGTHRNPIQLRS